MKTQGARWRLYFVIYLSAIADVDNRDQKDIIVEFIDNAVVADAQTKYVFISLQRLGISFREFENRF